MRVFRYGYCSQCDMPRTTSEETKTPCCEKCGQPITKLGKDWFIDYRLPNGKRLRERAGTNRKLAELALHKRKIQIVEGKFFDVDSVKKIKLSEFSEMFLKNYCKPYKLSWVTDEYHIKSFLEFFGDIYLDEIKPLNIEEFRRWKLDRGAKHSTANRTLTCLRTMLYKAIEWGYLKENPMIKVKLYKEDTRRLRFLEKEEIGRLLYHCSPHINNITLFALNTGMRRGEILGLKWSAVDFNNDLIYLHKTKSKEKRIIPMNSLLKKLLLNIREHSISEYVFCNKDGNQIKSIDTGFKKALKRAGIDDFRFHDLRHTFASHLVMRGVDLSTVKELLGHRSMEMTLRYAHLSQGHKSKAVEGLGQEMDHFWTNEPKEIKQNKLYLPKVIDKIGTNKTICLVV
jgi:integrase